MRTIDDTIRSVREAMGPRLDAFKEAMSAAYHLAYDQHDPEAAAGRLVIAINIGTAPQATEACLAGAVIFRGVGNNAAAIAWASQALQWAARSGDRALVARATDEKRLDDHLFHSAEWETRDTPRLAAMRGAESRRADGVTFSELMEGMGELHGSRDHHERRLFDELNRPQDVAVAVTGTLVQDRRGRFGVRDETTGRTTVLNVGGETRSADRLRADLGSTVRVEGTASLWNEGKQMAVDQYIPGMPRASARQGFRILDQGAQRAVDLGGRGLR
ncbi:MAG: hypothetical protein ACR2GX_08280 [Candidatus Dormibacteria bacterium]